MAESAGEGALGGCDTSGDDVEIVPAEIARQGKRPRKVAAAAVAPAGRYSTAAERLASLERRNTTKESAVWEVNVWSLYIGAHSAPYQHLVVCETCFGDDAKKIKEVNYGDKCSTTKLTEHLLRHHKEKWDALQKKMGIGGSKPLSNYFKAKDVGLQETIEWMVHTYQPISMVENPYFRNMVKAYKPSARLPDVKRMKEEMER